MAQLIILEQWRREVVWTALSKSSRIYEEGFTFKPT
jgi:hypothetical protein